MWLLYNAFLILEVVANSVQSLLIFPKPIRKKLIIKLSSHIEGEQFQIYTDTVHTTIVTNNTLLLVTSNRFLMVCICVISKAQTVEFIIYRKRSSIIKTFFPII